MTDLFCSMTLKDVIEQNQIFGLSCIQLMLCLNRKNKKIKIAFQLKYEIIKCLILLVSLTPNNIIFNVKFKSSVFVRRLDLVKNDFFLF